MVRTHGLSVLHETTQSLPFGFGERTALLIQDPSIGKLLKDEVDFSQVSAL